MELTVQPLSNSLFVCVFTDSEWVDSDKPDAKVDEFEEWKKQQKEWVDKQTPLDEAPPCYHDEVGAQTYDSQ